MSQIVMCFFEFSAYENLIIAFKKDKLEMDKFRKNLCDLSVSTDLNKNHLCSKNNFFQSIRAEDITKSKLDKTNEKHLKLKSDFFMNEIHGNLKQMVDRQIPKDYDDSFLSKISRKSKKIKEIQDWYNNLMSIQSFSRMQDELEKLKIIFFNDYQNVLFKLIEVKYNHKSDKDIFEKEISQERKQESNDNVTQKMLKILKEKDKN